MNNDLLPFLNSIKELFHTEMDQQTSACLYGSATTGDWVAARSDLDLLVFVPEEKIKLFGEKIKIWESKPVYPRLDGFVLSSSSNVPMVKEFYKFDKTAWHSVSFIPLIDLWKVKNQSVHLFGQDVKKFVREISREELKDWAIKDIGKYWIPHLSTIVSGADTSPERKIPLSALILISSGVAQILMLAKGNICTSKRELLKWLSEEHIEIRESINSFREDFEKPDNLALTLGARQALTLVKFYLGLLHEVKR